MTAPTDPTPSLPGSGTVPDQAPGTTRRGFLARAGLGGAALVAGSGALAACSDSGGSGGDGGGGADYEQGSAPLQVELGPEIEGVLYPEGYQGPRARQLEPFGDGEITFTILGRTIPDLDYSTNYYAGLVEEKTGVKVEYLEVPLGEDGQTKVNAILSAGDLPDAMMTGMGLFSTSQVAVYGQQGLFQPVDQLIDEHAPHIREMFETFPDMRSLFTSPDGRMYAVPSMNDCYHCKIGSVRTWYNTDWLTEVGAEVPQTLDDFDALLAEWKGLPSRTSSSQLVTTTSDTVTSLFTFFLGSFLEISADSRLLRDGKVTWLPTLDEYREGMIWIQEQFSKGHFDTAMFSATEEQIKRLADAPEGPQLGVTYGNSQGSFSSAADPSDPSNPAAIMVPLPPMEGPRGVRTTDWEWYSIGSPNFVITSSCQDPVTMIRWADYQFELSLTTAMGRGQEGPGWVWAGEGTLGIDGEQAVYEVVPGSTELKNTGWWEWGPYYKSMGQRHGEAVQEGTTSIEPSLYESAAAYEPYRIAKESKIPELAFDLDQSAEIGEIEANLNQHLTQSFANFGTGKADASKDADWTAFVETFSSMGLERYLEITQSAYDAQA
ncbi:extracellular solute-binding protein [Brachybacterium sp. J144]|uniref:extracellular solute-binding protein n=1 Tax=Brachybacterium sp. J144 TaxID=3116487 RepID=UPI002E7A4B3C|nr:extracellular solute-binding protein [Brachybacterium sp. J144]MEE1649445.1 extracellular solute-binding protein [Brachybacterium sp. J144]